MPNVKAYKRRARLPGTPGWKRVRFWDSAQTPCRCLVTWFMGIATTEVESWDTDHRCLECGRTWKR